MLQYFVKRFELIAFNPGTVTPIDFLFFQQKRIVFGHRSFAVLFDYVLPH